MRIWKWVLKVADVQVIDMPKGAQVLAVQTQGVAPCVWALVDEKAPPEPRVFDTYGTGNPMPDYKPTEIYRGSYQLHGGALVFHVFERTTPPKGT